MYKLIKLNCNNIAYSLMQKNENKNVLGCISECIVLIVFMLRKLAGVLCMWCKRCTYIDIGDVWGSQLMLNLDSEKSWEPIKTFGIDKYLYLNSLFRLIPNYIGRTQRLCTFFFFLMKYHILHSYLSHSDKLLASSQNIERKKSGTRSHQTVMVSCQA